MTAGYRNARNDDAPCWAGPRWGTWALGATLAAAVAFRVAAASKSLAYDELWVLGYILTRGPGEVAFGPFHTGNHILNSLLAQGSIAVLGVGELSARLPAIVMAAGTVMAAYAAGRTFLASRTGGLICAAVVALAPFHLRYGGVCRGYSAVMLFATLGGLCIYRAAATGSVKDALAFVGCAALCCWSQIASILLFGGWGAFALVGSVVRPGSPARARAALRPAGVALAAVLAGAAATLALYWPSLDIISQMRYRLEHGAFPPGQGSLSFGETGFGGGAAGEAVVTGVARDFLGIPWAPPWAAVGIAVVGVAGLSRRNRQAAILMACVLALPPLTLLATGIHLAKGRYFAFLFPYYAICVSAGCATLTSGALWLAARLVFRRGQLTADAAHAMAVIAVSAALALPALREARQPVYSATGGPWDAKRAAQFIANKARAGDVILIYPVNPNERPGSYIRGKLRDNMQYYLAKQVWPKVLAPLPRGEVGIWYLTPEAGLVEFRELPFGCQLSPVASYRNLHIYYGSLDLRWRVTDTPLPAPNAPGGQWRAVDHGGAPFAVHAASLSPGEAVWSLDVLGEDARFCVYSPPVPVRPGELIEFTAYVRGQPEHASIALSFVTEQGESLRQMFTSHGWREPQWSRFYITDDPAGLGWQRYVVTCVVPPEAAAAKAALFVHRAAGLGTRPGSRFEFRIASVRTTCLNPATTQPPRTAM